MDNEHTQRRTKRVATAAALAVALSLPAGYGVMLTPVLAWEDRGPAAFFRADKRRYAPARASRRPPRVTSVNRAPDVVIRKSFAPRPARAPARLNRPDETLATRGARTVCVRTCDGYFFPIGAYGSRKDLRGHAALCKGLCPGAPTKLFVLKPGDESVDDAQEYLGGRTYAQLPMAKRYREHRNNACSCQSSPRSVKISLRKDFTLRRGDAVMTKNGLRVFHGSIRIPHKARQFKALHRAKGLSRDVKRQLRQIANLKPTVILHRAEALASASPATPLPAFGPQPPSRDLMRAARAEANGFPSDPPLPARRPIDLASRH